MTESEIKQEIYDICEQNNVNQEVADKLVELRLAKTKGARKKVLKELLLNIKQWSNENDNK